MDREVNRKLIKAYSDIVKKDESKISVTLLCEKAEVSRATFYLYYKDMEDFTETVLEYLTNLLLKQAKLLMCSTENEIHYLVKTENLVFSKEELALFVYFINSNRYLEFAGYFEKIIKQCFVSEITNLNGEDFYNKNKLLFEFHLCAFITMLVFDLIFYNAKTFESDMLNCRKYISLLYNITKTK